MTTLRNLISEAVRTDKPLCDRLDELIQKHSYADKTADEYSKADSLEKQAIGHKYGAERDAAKSAIEMLEPEARFVVIGNYGRGQQTLHHDEASSIGNPYNDTKVGMYKYSEAHEIAKKKNDQEETNQRNAGAGGYGNYRKAHYHVKHIVNAHHYVSDRYNQVPLEHVRETLGYQH